MDEKSLGLVHFTDGHTEEILEAYQHVHSKILSFAIKSDIYVQVNTGDTFVYYKKYVNHDWETIYKRVNNIDYVELK